MCVNVQLHFVCNLQNYYPCFWSDNIPESIENAEVDVKNTIVTKDAKASIDSVDSFIGKKRKFSLFQRSNEPQAKHQILAPKSPERDIEDSNDNNEEMLLNRISSPIISGNHLV